jgi:polyhydroxyalkanoate synthase
VEAGDEGRAWLAACQWVDDTPALSGVAWVQWLADCYQHKQLVEGRMRIGGRPARLDHITAAVLRISGRRDIVTPPHQNAQRAHLPAAVEFSGVHVPAGHVGMVVGPTARSDVYEPLQRWLAPRSG